MPFLSYQHDIVLDKTNKKPAEKAGFLFSINYSLSFASASAAGASAAGASSSAASAVSVAAVAVTIGIDSSWEIAVTPSGSLRSPR